MSLPGVGKIINEALTGFCDWKPTFATSKKNLFLLINSFGAWLGILYS